MSSTLWLSPSLNIHTVNIYKLSQGGMLSRLYIYHSVLLHSSFHNWNLCANKSHASEIAFVYLMHQLWSCVTNKEQMLSVPYEKRHHKLWKTLHSFLQMWPKSESFVKGCCLTLAVSRIYLGKHKDMFVFSIHFFFQNWDGTGNWNPSSQKTNTFMVQSQYPGCWWPGDTRYQGISSQGFLGIFQF